VLIGGSAISARLAELLKPFKNEIYHTYGMTETCSMVAIKLLSQDSSENHYTFFDTIAWHLNEDSCIKIKGAITNNEWIETHDRATVVSEESVYIHGRSDFVINSGGIKIYPEQLEAEIDSLMQKFMFRYMFSYMPDAVLGQRLVMVLEADTLKHELAYEIYNKLSSQLDKMKLPKEIYCMPQFIYTDQGKFRRNEIQALLHEAKCIQLVTPIIHK
jgi:O-succinylbenzoic acid--CoA ligase